MTFSVHLKQGIKGPSQHFPLYLFYLEINYTDTILLLYIYIVVTILWGLLNKKSLNRNLQYAVFYLRCTECLTSVLHNYMKGNKEKPLTWCSRPPQACALEWVSIFLGRWGPGMPCTLKCHCFQKRVYDFPLVENKLMVKMNISSQQLPCFIRWHKNIIF